MEKFNLKTFNKWKTSRKIKPNIVKIVKNGLYINEITLKGFTIKPFVEFLYDIDINIIVLDFKDEETKNSYKFYRKNDEAYKVNLVSLIKFLNIKSDNYPLSTYDGMLFFKYVKNGDEK